MKTTGKKILLSIVVPIYNAELYLEQCLESIIQQCNEEIEVILVDDGSRDKSPAICDAYLQKYSNINVIHKENGGSVSARKSGVMKAQGNYITFVDSDDWVDDGYFLQIINIIKSCSSDIIAVNKHYKVETNGETILSIESERIGLYEKSMLEKEVYPELLYKEPFYSFGVTPTLCLKTIKRDLLTEFITNVPNQISMGEDLCTSFPAILAANNIYFSNICGYYYRMNPTSITHTYDKKAANKIVTLLEYIDKEIGKYDEFAMKQQIEMYAAWIVAGAIGSLVLGSNDIRYDLNSMQELLKNEYVVRGTKRKIPPKSKILLKLAEDGNADALKLLRAGVTLKNKLKPTDLRVTKKN